MGLAGRGVCSHRPLWQAAKVAFVQQEFDSEKVAALKRSDARAERAFVELYAPRVHAFLVRMLGPLDAEDATQEVLLRGLKHIGRFSSDRSPKLSSWLFAIANNYAIDVLRKRQRRQKFLDSWRWLNVGSYEDPQGLSEIEGALDTLDPEVRSALILKHCVGLDYREVAESLGCKEGTAKSKISRGLSKLRKELGLAQDLGEMDMIGKGLG